MRENGHVKSVERGLHILEILGSSTQITLFSNRLNKFFKALNALNKTFHDLGTSMLKRAKEEDLTISPLQINSFLNQLNAFNQMSDEIHLFAKIKDFPGYDAIFRNSGMFKFAIKKTAYRISVQR